MHTTAGSVTGVHDEAFEIVTWSAAPPEAVFGLLADIEGWKRWAGPLIHDSTIEVPGHTDRVGVGAIRRLGWGRASSREEIVVHDPPRHHAYILHASFPLRGYRADVELFEAGRGGTVIRWRGSFRPVVPGTGGILRRYMSATVAGFARRLARAAASPASA